MVSARTLFARSLGACLLAFSLLISSPFGGVCVAMGDTASDSQVATEKFDGEIISFDYPAGWMVELSTEDGTSVVAEAEDGAYISVAVSTASLGMAEAFGVSQGLAQAAVDALVSRGATVETYTPYETTAVYVIETPIWAVSSAGNVRGFVYTEVHPSTADISGYSKTTLFVAPEESHDAYEPLARVAAESLECDREALAAAVIASQPVPEPVDKTELTDLIIAAWAIDSNSYTAESYARVRSLIDEGGLAATVFGDPEATEEEVAEATSQLNTAIAQLEEVFNPAGYVQLPYRDVSRTPDAYEGSLMWCYGRVLQVLEDDGVTILRVATSGNWDDVVLVMYASDVLDYRILEDDWVTVYGMCNGLYSYKSTGGSTITIPYLLGFEVFLG